MSGYVHCACRDCFDIAVEYADRVVLGVGFSPEEFDGVYACDLDSPRGMVLFGLNADEDIIPLADAEILWKSWEDV